MQVVAVSELIDPETPLEEVSRRVEKWLDDRWTEKEAQMNYFIEHQTFTDDWNKNRKVEVWNRVRKLRDSIEWMPLLLGSFAIHFSIIKLIKWLMSSVIPQALN